ncbi:MAG: hypothetical protein MK102_17185 [Fuerstiella sp.]|nr:hypothetical protein [Fuerstiella sp.]
MKLTPGITSICLICITLSWGAPSTAQENVSNVSDTIEAVSPESANSVVDSSEVQTGGVQSGPSRIRPDVKESRTTNPETLQVVPVTGDTIQRAVESGDYVLFYRANLHRLLLDGYKHVDIGLPPVATLATARYRAELTEDMLSNGTLIVQLNATADVDSCVLGQTNLRELEFRFDGHPVASAALSDGRLSLLTGAEATQLEATWTASGIRTSDGTLFELQLPPAIVTELQIQTASDIRITSPNAIVRSESVADRRVWSLSPRASHAVTFLCQPVENSTDSHEMSTVAVDTTFNVSSKTVFAEWTFVVPPELDDSSVRVTVSDNCHITDVVSQSGRRCTWSLAGESSRRLIVSGLQTGGTIVIYGTSDADRHGSLVLPLLAAAQQLSNEETGPAVSLRSTGLRLVVTRGLAVHHLDLVGLYQEEVSFNSAGEQVIELRQFDVDAAATIHVVASTAAVRQKLLIHRRPDTPERVTVYAELEPCSDNDDVYKTEWNISGPWRPVSVYDMRTDLPVYSRVRPSDDGTSDQLQVEFRSAATSSQPAWLRIEFRSTQAVTPLMSSLPILINERYRTTGNWILASEAAPFLTNAPTEAVTDIVTKLQNEFGWTMVDISEPELLQMTKTADLLPATAGPSVPETAIYNAILTYELQLTKTQLIENLQIQVDSSEQLPESIILLFPEGIDLQLDSPASASVLSATGRLTNDYWQEWLLALPAARTSGETQTFNLRATRPLANVEFAAIPRLPNASGISLTARNITAMAAEFSNVALVAESSDDGDLENLPLQPGNQVMVGKVANQFRIQFTPTSERKPFLGIRGTAWFAVSPEDGGGTCQCFADLVVSRTGAVEDVAVQWPEATNIRIYMDDQPVEVPVTDSTIRILLPKNQTTTGIRILWTSPVSETGLITPAGVITPPQFDADVKVDLSHIVQLPPGCYAVPSSKPGLSDRSNMDLRGSLQLATVNTPVKDFLMRWRLAEQLGAGRSLISTENGQIHVSMVSRRLMYCGAILVFWGVIIGSRVFARLRLRTVAVLMLTGFVLSVFAGPLISSLLFGFNSGLGVYLVFLTGRQLLKNSGDQVLLTRDHQPAVGSIPSAASAALALLLTGQAPLPSDLPSILINEEARTTLPFVYIRRNLLPAADGAAESEVRVLNVAAHVRVEQGGGSEITVRATVANRLTGHASEFNLPTGSATLTDCSLDHGAVSPSRGPLGNPQLRIPVQTDALASTNNDNGWERHDVNYTLRTNVRQALGHYNIRVPLPFSARCQLTLETVDDQVLTARLAESSGTRAVSSDVPGVMAFPMQYNRGPLDISVETRNSLAAASETVCVAAVTCRAELSDSGTKLICRYQMTSQQRLPTELILLPVPRYQIGDVLSKDGLELQLIQTDGRQIVRGSPEQLADFYVSWEATKEEMTVDRLIPAAALRAPERCLARRILIAVQASDPLEVDSVVIAGGKLSESHPGEEVRESLELTQTDQVFEIGSIPDDIHLKLRKRTTRQTAQVTSRIIADVDQLSWSIHCDIETTGSEIFRQRIQVQPELLVDRVEVSAGDVNRLRSWSYRDGLLLICLREGTRGSFELMFEGTLSIPDSGNLHLIPARLDSTEVIKSTVSLLSTSDATVVLETEDGSDQNIDPERPTVVDNDGILKLNIRRQQVTTVRMLMLAQDRALNQHADAAVRIEAGDQGWNGRIRLPDSLRYTSAEWTVDEAVTPLTLEGLELLPVRLTPGQRATLMLTGIQVVTTGTARRIPLPIPEPKIPIDRVQVYERLVNSKTSDQSHVPWMMESLESESLIPPLSGWVQLGERDHYDAQANSVRVDTVPLVNSSPAVSIVRQPARCVTVTTLYPVPDMISGTTDILVEFGEADESQCVIPANMKIVSCRLDDVELPPAANPNIIAVNRQSAVQRLTIDWLIRRPEIGFFPHEYRLLVPSLAATKQTVFLTIHSPIDQVWSVDHTLIPITSAQLAAHIVAAFPVSYSPDDAITQTSDTGSVETVARFLDDRELTFSDDDQLFQVTGPTATTFHSRRRLPWLHVLPVIALCIATVVSGGQRIFRQRAPEAAHVRGRDSSHQSRGHADAESVSESESSVSAEQGRPV